MTVYIDGFASEVPGEEQARDAPFLSFASASCSILNSLCVIALNHLLIRSHPRCDASHLLHELDDFFRLNYQLVRFLKRQGWEGSSILRLGSMSTTALIG